MPSIVFESIKPHQGDRRRAFEELSHQLFALEMQPHTAIRREGAGGDGGLESFAQNKSGGVIVGLQAKYFVGPFAKSWFSKIDQSVSSALESCSDRPHLEEYVIAVPIVLTAGQRTANRGAKGCQAPS